MTDYQVVDVIGKPAEISIDGLYVEVTVLDVRFAYGRIDYQIEPVAGRGQVWVDSKRVVVHTNGDAT